MTAVTRPVRHKKPFPWKEALRILVLTLISLLMIFPIFWMISGSLKAPHEVMNKDVFWPAKPYWENYAIAWKSAPFGQYFKNSILMATTVVICQVLTGSLAGYAFAKLPFKLSKPIFFLFLCSMMIPSEATIVSNFLTLAALRLTNTFFSVIVVSLVSMFSVFLFRQFYKTIDNALLEAAYIDGAGDLRVYWSIILPLSKSAIATVAIIGFIGTMLGYAMGLSLGWALKRYQFIKLPENVYTLDHLPIIITWSDVLIIGASAMLLCFLATLYPARQASRLEPAEALRYE